MDFDFQLGEMADTIRDTTVRFARERIAPLAAEIDRDDRFPAEIWRLFLEPALEGTEPESFPEPKFWPEWKPFTRGEYALTYDPNAAPQTTEEEETVEDEGDGDGGSAPNEDADEQRSGR